MTITPASFPGGLDAIGPRPGSLVNVKQTEADGHALTAYLAAAGGTSQAAVNAISDNSASSAVEVTGCETGRGTVKISHLGYGDGSDANAAGISIDLKTTNGATTGTHAQGVFITSTSDSLPVGDPMKVRYNASDYFIVKGGNSYTQAGKGILGINIPTGHFPLGMIEVRQKADGTPALALTNAAGLTVTLSVDATGNLTAQMPSGATRVIAAN